MSLLKKYGKWISKKNPRRYDVAELLSGIIFVPSISIGIELLHHKYSLWITILIMFLIINFYLLIDDLFARFLGKFNVKISKWMTAIPWLLVFIYIVFNNY
ncbi:hypothetical protein CN601_26135 [Bacillus sp. AFS017336]|nr:hypothetical protein CN601_26135 [Bacillus sp. AFS017336]